MFTPTWGVHVNNERDPCTYEGVLTEYSDNNYLFEVLITLEDQSENSPHFPPPHCVHMIYV